MLRYSGLNLLLQGFPRLSLPAEVSLVTLLFVLELLEFRGLLSLGQVAEGRKFLALEGLGFT